MPKRPFLRWRGSQLTRGLHHDGVSLRLRGINQALRRLLERGVTLAQLRQDSLRLGRRARALQVSLQGMAGFREEFDSLLAIELPVDSFHCADEFGDAALLARIRPAQRLRGLDEFFCDHRQGSLQTPCLDEHRQTNPNRDAILATPVHDGCAILSRRGGEGGRP